MGLEALINSFRHAPHERKTELLPVDSEILTHQAEMVNHSEKVTSPEQLIHFLWQYANFTIDTIMTAFPEDALSDLAESDVMAATFFQKIADFTKLFVPANKLVKRIVDNNVEIDQPQIDEITGVVAAIQATGFTFIEESGQSSDESFSQKSEYYAFLFHDLGNMLTLPHGYAELYKERPNFGEVRKKWIDVCIGYMKRMKYFMSQFDINSQEITVYQEEIVRIEQFFIEEAHKVNESGLYAFNTRVAVDPSLRLAANQTSRFTLSLAMRFFDNIVQNTQKAYVDQKSKNTVSRKELLIGMRVEAGNLYITFDDFGVGFNLEEAATLKLTLGRLLSFDKPFVVRTFNFDGTSYWESPENSGNGIGMAGLKKIVEKVLNGELIAGNRLGLGPERGGARVEIAIPLD